MLVSLPMSLEDEIGNPLSFSNGETGYSGEKTEIPSPSPVPSPKC